MSSTSPLRNSPPQTSVAPLNAQNAVASAPLDQAIARLVQSLEVSLFESSSTQLKASMPSLGALSELHRAAPPSVKPSDFQQGQTYKQTRNADGSYTYTQVSPNQVPPGAIVYVNGLGSNGDRTAQYAQVVSQNNQNRDVYVVRNDTPALSFGQITQANDNPDTDNYAPIQTLLAIAKATGGKVTMMGHSMGEALEADALIQYHDAGGNLSQSYLYGWGGVANSANADKIVQWGGHATDFVHEEIDKVDASGNSTVVQSGDSTAGGWASFVDGANWLTKTVDQNGHVTGIQSDDPSTVVGIDYDHGAPTGGTGHDYIGQIGNTLGRTVTQES